MTQNNLLHHPTIRAWRQLYPEGPQPKGFDVLKEEGHKSAAYSIEGVGLAGSAVIAKRCRRHTALLERTIYAEILPCLPIPALHYYGFLEEPEGKFCWLFIEDAGGEEYTLDFKVHGALVARWLGDLHTSAESVAATISLPDRGPNHYFQQMRWACNVVQPEIANPALGTEDRAVLTTIVSKCDFLERHWSQLDGLCERMPRTLVHGDFAAKNARVRRNQHGEAPVLFDWEMAGWGVPAVDLYHFTRYSGDLEMSAYWLAMRERWPHLTFQDIHSMVKVGAIFRSLDALQWGVQTLTGGSVVVGLGRNLSFYESRLTNAVRAIEWAD